VRAIPRGTERIDAPNALRPQRWQLNGHIAVSLLSSLLTQYFRARANRGTRHQEPCPVCGAPSSLYGAVDFNKSCEELRGKFLPPSDIPVAYYRCTNCEFCFAPEIAKWNLAEFEERIYNKDYALVDPDYAEARPQAIAGSLRSMFGSHGLSIKHLDYGGGNGRLSRLLAQEGWNSSSYDPFVDRNRRAEELGQFDLITAFEVFEHVPNPRKLMQEVSTLLVPDGIVLFSTLLSDGILESHEGLKWWYASPRNGHISLFSTQSLNVLAGANDFQLGTLAHGLHCMWRSVPDWAAHLLSAGGPANEY
jgi:SAM-dependent methyltransferase